MTILEVGMNFFWIHTIWHLNKGSGDDDDDDVDEEEEEEEEEEFGLFDYLQLVT